MKLLSRDTFREQVFARDKGRCVFCGEPAQDAHHILERRLWNDGGYYLENGASVCEQHHLACESTDISVEEVRAAAGITKKILPGHLYDDVIFDKWGNVILPSGMRLKGELFYDESVQKILTGHLDKFLPYVKYPRTYHLPWSENIHDDDRVMPNLDGLTNKWVVVTEKMDGENTTMYSNYIHARSLDSRNHESRNWVKNFHGKICGEIPAGWRICGENLYAKHSILYPNLQSYFYGFSIWNERNECLSWDDTLEWFNLLEITPVPIMFRGTFNEKVIKTLDIDCNTQEGYVVRITDKFNYVDYKRCVGKYVRKNHIQTVKHWMHGQRIETNGLQHRGDD